MRFRIKKNNDGSAYAIIVFGVMDDAAGCDILQVAQTMLNRPHCTELMIDFRSAMLKEDLSVFNTDTLTSVFEEAMLKKDSVLIIRYHNDYEIRFSSDQLPLQPISALARKSLDEAEFFSKVMRWLDQEARFMIN
jgi:hypothetical protein